MYGTIETKFDSLCHLRQDKWFCDCLGGHGGDARALYLPQRAHHHGPGGSAGGYQGKQHPDYLLNQN